MKRLPLLLGLVCMAASVVAETSVMTLEERYRALCDEKARADASAIANRDAAIGAVEEGAYVEVYRRLLAARDNDGRELRLLTFRGQIANKRDVVLGKKEMVVLASTWSEGNFEITISLDESPREELRIGSIVLVSGRFVRGTFAGVSLKHANVTLVQREPSNYRNNDE